MTEKQDRLISLDAFRGATIALMILVNTPGTWGHVYAPLRHAQWHGCTLTDLVFPFFLFIIGVSMRFSFEKYEFCKWGPLFKKVVWRTITIFTIGLLLNAFPFVRQDWDWSHFRIMGVLQRIALAYIMASFIVVRADIIGIVKISLGLLFGYWILLMGYGWYSGLDPYALKSNLILIVDAYIFGENHLYGGTGIAFDPEGLLSTIPSIVTVLIGFLVGTMIKTAEDHKDNTQRMAVLGALLIIFGWGWGFVFPINKQLWTSSYVLYTSGIATVVLAGLIWLVDVKGLKTWTKPFVIFGANAIFLYAASGIWVKILLKISFELDGKMISGYGYLYQTVFQPFAGDLNGSFLFALFHVFMFWLILAWMYRKKIFIKI
jgi:predicted acyltransferase|tara:strand:+ start:338 stop:1462 length:1125 start_codon:yes stop_codon:yes gene_type:complete